MVKGQKLLIYGLYLDRKLLKYEEGVNIKKIDSPPHPRPLPQGEREIRGIPLPQGACMLNYEIIGRAY